MFARGLAHINAQVRLVEGEYGGLDSVLFLEVDQVAGDRLFDAVHLFGIDRIAARTVGLTGREGGAAAAQGAEHRPTWRGPGADDHGHSLLRQLAGHLHGLLDSGIGFAAASRRQWIHVLVGLPDGPRHLDPSPGGAQVVQRVLNDLGIGAGILQAEVAAESVEDLTGAGGVDRELHWIPIDLAGDLEREALPNRLTRGELAGGNGQQDLDIVAALASIVAHEDLGGLIEHDFDLSARGEEAHAGGRGAQVLILFGGAGGEGSLRQGGRHGLDELRGAAGE